MTSQSKKYIFAGKPFSENLEGKYFNLNSHRFISKKPRDMGADFVLWDSPRVAGYPGQLEEFFKTNNLPVPDQFKSKVEQKATEPITATTVTESASQLAGSIAKAISAIPALSTLLPFATQTICKKTGTVILSNSSVKIEDVPYEQLDSLCNFSFYGLKTKARLMYLVDGDTFDLAFFCPLDIFTQKSTEGKKTGARAILSTSGEGPDEGMILKVRCRLWGADAAEKRTVRGPIATQLFKDYTLADKNEKEWYVYIQCFGGDKYGRVLTRLFQDPNFEKPLEEKLLAYRHPIYGAVYNSYYGGKKEEFTEPVIPFSLPTFAQPIFLVPPLSTQ